MPSGASSLSPEGVSAQGGDHLGRRLHQLDQHALASDRKLVIALGVKKADVVAGRALADAAGRKAHALCRQPLHGQRQVVDPQDRKSTRLNSSHSQISYAVFCLKKKKKKQVNTDI